MSNWLGVEHQPVNHLRPDLAKIWAYFDPPCFSMQSTVDFTTMCFLGRFVPWRGLGVCFKPGRISSKLCAKWAPHFPSTSRNHWWTPIFRRSRRIRRLLGNSRSFWLVFENNRQAVLKWENPRKSLQKTWEMDLLTFNQRKIWSTNPGYYEEWQNHSVCQRKGINKWEILATYSETFQNAWQFMFKHGTPQKNFHGIHQDSQDPFEPC